MVLPQVSSKTTARLIQLRMFKIIFTITARILARSLANLYRQEADRHMNLHLCDAAKSESGQFDSVCYRKKTNGRQFFMRLSCY